MMLPNPWQRWQAPNGLLNEKSRGCGTSYGIAHVRHSKRSLNRRVRRTAPASSTSTANAAPSPSRKAVSIESITRVRASVATLMRSTMTASDGTSRSAAGEAAASSMAMARSPTSSRPNPRRRSIRSASTTGSPPPTSPHTTLGVWVDRLVCLVSSGPRHPDDCQVEPDEQAGAFRQGQQLLGDQSGRLPLDLPATDPAEGATDPRPQEPQVVVDLGGRADGRARVPDAVLLADRNRRRNAFDRIDVRLLHPLEELPGIGGQRLDVPALTLRIDRVEGQGRLPRPADPGEDDQLAVREHDVDALQVVRAGAANDERTGGGLRGRWRDFGHGQSG